MMMNKPFSLNVALAVIAVLLLAVLGTLTVRLFGVNRNTSPPSATDAPQTAKAVPNQNLPTSVPIAPRIVDGAAVPGRVSGGILELAITRIPVGGQILLRNEDRSDYAFVLDGNEIILPAEGTVRIALPATLGAYDITDSRSGDILGTVTVIRSLNPVAGGQP